MTVKAKNYGIPTSQKFGSHDASFVWVYLEDYYDGRPASEHFFYDTYHTPATRFGCWDSGGGIGNRPTEEEAMKHLHEYAAEALDRKIAEAESNLAVMKRSRQVLGKNPSGLEAFLVPEDWNPARANGKQSY